MPDRAKRKADIPNEAPEAPEVEPDEKVRRLGRQLVKVLARGASSLTYKAMQKARHSTPHIVDIGQHPLPPPYYPPNTIFSGKGRRLADGDSVPSKNVIQTIGKTKASKKKPAGASGRARSKANAQLALMPIDVV